MLKNLKLRTSILLGFTVPITIFIIAAFLVILNIKVTKNATNVAIRSNLVSQNSLKMEIAAGAIIQSTRGYILSKNKEQKERVDKENQDFLHTLDELKSLVVDDEQKARLLQLQALQKQLMQISRQEIDLVDHGNVTEATKMVKKSQISSVWTNFTTVMGEFSNKQQSLLQKRSEQQMNSLMQLGTIAWSSCLIATVLTIFLGFWIAGRIGIGNVLQKSINTLASSSAEISATVDQHERTVIQQTSSISKTTATTEELRISAQTSSNQAENAATVVKKALQLAEEGNRSSERASISMGELQEKMRGVAEQILQLSEQAGQIGVIAKVVGDLASETNMLALNAAVEAARAGENGKGFAVVASEVRKLADQSKKSAERANALVADIQKATNSAVMVAEEGSKTAKEVFNITLKNGETFRSLTEYADMIDQNAQQVVFNSRQQAGALAQISEAMRSLNTGATEMAAGTRQTKLGLQNLTDVATSLKAII